AHDLGALFTQAALITRVPPVDLLFFLVARQLHFRGVHDDHMVARVEKRRVRRLVLALQQASRAAGHPPEDEVLGVDDVPVARNRRGGWGERAHGLRAPFGLPFRQNCKPKGYRPIEKNASWAALCLPLRGALSPLTVLSAARPIRRCPPIF